MPYPLLRREGGGLDATTPIARNHALVDGNKRLAWAACRVFCLLNDRDLVIDVDEAELLVVSLAAGRIDVPALAIELRDQLRPT